MNAQRREALYSREMLGLAVELALFPYKDGAQLTGTARSRTCGSTVDISAELDARGQLSDIGLKVSACAVGQASAAIFAQHACDIAIDELNDQLLALKAWLSESGPMPQWPRFEMLAPALQHTGRHEAILLPWRAAIDALSMDQTAR